MTRLILALLFGLVTTPAWAAVTFDAVITDTGTIQTSASLTIAADANLVVVVVGGRDEDGNAETPSSVTVGGQAATLITGCEADRVAAVGINTTLWAKVSPLTGAQTVVADAANNEQMVMTALSFKGAALTNTFGTCVTLATSTAAVDVNTIGSAVGEMGVMGVTLNATATCAPDATAPTSDERSEFANGVNVQQCTYTEAGAATSIDMRADLGTARDLAAVGVSIRAARPGGVAPIFFE